MDATLVPPQTAAWVSALFDMAMGRKTLDELLAMSDASSQPQKLRAEAYFHSAMMALDDGNRTLSVSLLEKAMRCYDSEERYAFHAKTLWTKMERDPFWPAWMNRNLAD
jgi:hypothetical protein